MIIFRDNFEKTHFHLDKSLYKAVTQSLSWFSILGLYLSNTNSDVRCGINKILGGCIQEPN